MMTRHHGGTCLSQSREEWKPEVKGLSLTLHAPSVPPPPPPLLHPFFFFFLNSVSRTRFLNLRQLILKNKHQPWSCGSFHARAAVLPQLLPGLLCREAASRFTSIRPNFGIPLTRYDLKVRRRRRTESFLDSGRWSLPVLVEGFELFNAELSHRHKRGGTLHLT